MMLASALFLLGLQPSPALPAPDAVRWEMVPGGNPAEPLAIDPGSLVRDGDRVTVTVYARRSPPAVVRAYVSRWTIDCRARILAFETTDEYGADGVRFPPAPDSPATTAWFSLDAMTGGPALAARVCQARRQG